MTGKIDVIIATYNRIDKAVALAHDVIKIGGNNIQKVVLVDSSDIRTKQQFQNEKIIQIYSDFKNQPFQRYLGYCYSKAEILLFLDDDMEIIDNNFINDLSSFYKNNEFIGLNIPFKNVNSFLESQPKGIFKFKNLFLSKIKGILLGYPTAPDNQFIFCGIKGNRIANKEIKYFSGGAFSALQSKLYINFNMQHFNLYEEKLGLGEDGLLGFTLSFQGKIWAWEKEYLIHNDLKNSSYSSNLKSFAKKFIFSRINLNYEYYRLTGSSKSGILRYIHFAIFRIIGSIFIMIFKDFSNGKEKTIGYLLGFFKAFNFKFSSSLKHNEHWHKIALDQINKNNL